jgi:thioesterase domain-containing protein
MERYLHEHIPLAAAMAVRVLASTADAVVLEAPLEPNLNHRDTAFGGSVAAVAILAGWTLVHRRLHREGISGRRTVIRSSDVRYVAPVDGAFRATCPAPTPEAWARFVRMLERKGMARIAIHGEVTCRGTLAATFEGDYVALGGPDEAS